jgi:diguanylate cyclase (GGDEF)-like protein
VVVSFRNRLAVFMILTLVVVQGATAMIIYGVTRQALINQSENQLTNQLGLFFRQMGAVSQRVADIVQVLSLDFALRQAVAEQNEQTVRSALRNFGRRVGAARMEWIDMNGLIQVDSVDDSAKGRSFGEHDLLDQAVVDGHARGISIVDGRAYWIVLVPVLAPVPIGFIGANISLDDAMVENLRQLSGLPQEILLIAPGIGGHQSTILARSVQSPAAIPQLLPDGGPPPLDQPLLRHSGEREDIVLAKNLPGPEAMGVVAVVGFSLDEALRPYHPVILAASGLLLVGLLAALLCTSLIARSVARPIEALAVIARRIAGGDYTPPAAVQETEEISQLSGALANMAIAIGEREDRIRFQALHDVITGLPNRLSLTDAIDRDLADRPDIAGSLLVVGVPRVQEIVNTLGHDFRDRLMRHVGQRLLATAGPVGQVARVSDIAFALWLPGARDPLQTAHGLMAGVGEDYREGDITVDVATAIGIVTSPEHGTEGSLLLQRADTALHQALEKADDRVVVYDLERDPHRSDRLSLMSDLREALDADQLKLFYQPKIDLMAGQVAGAEGLVRWTHAVRGFVPPDSFIGLAEETGNIRRLTQWALATGIAQAADWAKRGMRIRISVNLSVRDLADPTLPQRVAEALEMQRVPASAVILEITESAIMGEPDKAIAVLRRLADMGIDLSIDDFGVGQSSFAYLRRLPVREIKIDKSFVLKLASNEDDATIVRSIVELGHNLGYRVTAEGVEDEGSFNFLRQIGCDYAQGYFIAKAMATDGFDRFLAESRWPAHQGDTVS